MAEQRRVVARIEELAAQIHEAHALRPRAAEQTNALLHAGVRRWIGSVESPLWPLRELESLCSVFVDCDHRTPDYTEQGVPLLRPRDIRAGSLLLEGAVRITPTEHERRCIRHRPAARDIVYSRELSFGNAAMIPADVQVSLGQGTLLMRADPGVVMDDYLVRALNAPVVREQAIVVAKGAAHPHVNLSDIRVFRVPLPPLAMQRRIVVQLATLKSEVDSVIRLQNGTYAELDAQLPAVLDRAFKGDL